MKVAFLALALAAMVSASPAFADQDNSLASNMMKTRPSEVHLYGTLAPKGSFEEKASGTYVELAHYRDSLFDKLQAGKLTADQTVAANSYADQVRELLDESFRACKQDNKSGLCTGDSAKAGKLLGQAKALLKKIVRK